MSVLLFKRRSQKPLSPIGAANILEWWSPSQSAQTVNSDGTGGAPGDGGSVGRITGLISGTQLIQATAGNKPTYRATGPGGAAYPAWQFDGGDFLTADALAATFSGSDKPFTLIACVAQTSTVGTQTVWSCGSSSAASPRQDCGYTGSGPARFSRQDDAAANTTSNAAGGGGTTLKVLSWLLSGTVGYIWRNYTPDLEMAADVGAMTVDQFTFGCLRRTINAQFFSGYIAEPGIMICSGIVSNAELFRLVNYFRRNGAVP